MNLYVDVTFELDMQHRRIFAIETKLKRVLNASAGSCKLLNILKKEAVDMRLDEMAPVKPSAEPRQSNNSESAARKQLASLVEHLTADATSYGIPRALAAAQLRTHQFGIPNRADWDDWRSLLMKLRMSHLLRQS